MTTKGTGTYQVTGWDEKPYDEDESAAKLSKARITNTFAGAIEGAGVAEYVMAYASNVYASFVGMQRVTGSVGGRSGSFVLQTSGVYEGGVTTADWFVVPGSGRDELVGLTGKGGYVAKDSTNCDVTLDFDFE